MVCDTLNNYKNIYLYFVYGKRSKPSVKECKNDNRSEQIRKNW